MDEGITQVMREKSREMDLEIHFKDAFRAFSKDDEGLSCTMLKYFTNSPHLHTQVASQLMSSSL